MNHFIVSAYAVFVFSLAGGAYFLFRGREAERVFGWFWLTVAFWSYFVAMQSRLLRWMPDRLWGWLLHVGCIFVPILFFHFARALPNSSRKGSWDLRAVYLGGILFVLLNTFTNLFTAGTIYTDAYAYPRPALLYPLYIAFFQVVGIWSMFLLVKWEKTLPVGTKKWLHVFLIFFVLAYAGSMDNFLIMYELRIFPLYPYGLYLILPFVVFGGYAVRKLGSSVGSL